MIDAHLGHWYESVLYLGPFAALGVFLMIQHRRDRRRQRKEP